jgi:hypothetical protein
MLKIRPLAGFALSIWGFVEIGFLRGTAEPNRYGPNPLALHAAKLASPPPRRWPS